MSGCVEQLSSLSGPDHAGGGRLSGDRRGCPAVPTERFDRVDFNGDGFADLAIGAAGEDVGAATDAGAVNVQYGSSTGLPGPGGQLFTQNSPGVGGTAESGDGFGSALD